MILRRDDPLVKPLQELGEPVFVVDSNPTVEHIAKIIFDFARVPGPAGRVREGVGNARRRGPPTTASSRLRVLVLLVFDLDGTLVDSIHDLAEAASDLSERYGGARFDDEAVCRMVGEGASVLVERVLARAGHAEPPPGALEEFLDLYDVRMFDTTRAYPGMADTLRALADGHAMALLTNKPEAAARKVLAHCGLDGFFAHWSSATAGSSGSRTRPACAG